MKIVAISLATFFAGITVVALLCYATRKVTQAFDYLTHPPESLQDRWEIHYVTCLILHEDNSNPKIDRLIAALDEHISRHLVTMSVTEYDLLCDALGLEPTDKAVVEAFMAAGWRMRLIFAEDSLAMDGKLEYHASKDKRLRGEVRENAS